ncbi:unnamed protein product [Knipowitschia caucasica]
MSLNDNITSGAARRICCESVTGLHVLESAAQHFILHKDFETVFETCDGALQNITKGDQEDERSEDVKTGFCILGIQALAELNEWCRVLPWVLQQYESQEKIPAKIIQMCILLYSKVGEAVVVSDVVHVWLHCGANGRASGFATVMELYLAHILLPLGQLEEARELILGEVGISTLSEEQRQMALIIIDEKHNDHTSLIPSASFVACPLTSKPQGTMLFKLGAIIKYLYKKLLGPLSGSSHLPQGLLVVVLLYMLLLRLDPALPSSFIWITKLHQMIRQLWTALFGPHYHAMKK